MKSTDKKLQSRKVFLDTEVFIRHRHDLFHPSFSSLGDLGKKKLLELFITKIVESEIITHINRTIEDSLDRISNAKSKLGFLKYSGSDDIKSLLVDINRDNVKNAAADNWDKWKKESNVQVISIDNVNSNVIFKKYFSESPPFDGGKKKNEFPDAFSLEAINTYAIENNTKVYILSADPDLEKSCCNNNYLIYVENLEEFLNIYNRTEKQLSEFVDDLIQNNEDEFYEPIAHAFSDYYHTHEDYEDSEVEILDVTHVEISVINIIRIDEADASVELTIYLEGCGKLSGPDYNSAVWDNESKQLIIINYLNEEIALSGTFKFDAEIVFDTEDKNYIEIIEVIGSRFTFPSDDDFPY